MKVLFLTPWYPDEQVRIHGVFIQEQAHALSGQHEIVVISSKVDYQAFSFSHRTCQESLVGGLKEYRLVVKRSLPIYNQVNYLNHSYRFSLQVAADFRPDIIHGNIGYPGAAWAWRLARSLKVPYVVTEHASNFENHFRSPFHRWLTITPLMRANAVIAVSNHSASQIENYVHRSVDVIPNLVRTHRFSISRDRREPPTIGFLGSLDTPTHAKGLPQLLKALSGIDLPWKLAVGGGGRLLEEYKQLANELRIQDRCDFAGYIEYDQVPGFMKSIDFFVNVSKHESFGIAIVEAMACGLPVVVYNNGGPADFVNDTNGLLVENQDQEALKHAIEKMIVHHRAYDPASIREQVVRRYSAEAFLARMTDLYNKLLKQAT